jgi:hypothetical protein
VEKRCEELERELLSYQQRLSEQAAAASQSLDHLKSNSVSKEEFDKVS